MRAGGAATRTRAWQLQPAEMSRAPGQRQRPGQPSGTAPAAPRVPQACGDHSILSPAAFSSLFSASWWIAPDGSWFVSVSGTALPCSRQQPVCPGLERSPSEAASPVFPSALPFLLCHPRTKPSEAGSASGWLESHQNVPKIHQAQEHLHKTCFLFPFLSRVLSVGWLGTVSASGQPPAQRSPGLTDNVQLH